MQLFIHHISAYLSVQSVRLELFDPTPPSRSVRTNGVPDVLLNYAVRMSTLKITQAVEEFLMTLERDQRWRCRSRPELRENTAYLDIKVADSPLFTCC